MKFFNPQDSDLIRIAQCHRSVFPQSLTSKMGLNYLSKLFSWYLATDKAFLLCVEDDGEIIGYAGGMIVDGTLAHGSASSLAQHTFNDSIKALFLRPWLFFHPEFLTRLSLFTRNVVIRIRDKFRKNKVRSALKPSEPYVGLVVIGVHPAYQGKGYGSIILKEFENQSLSFGFKRMLLTVNAHNLQAIKSYKRNGWSVVSYAKKSASMEKRLS